MAENSRKSKVVTRDYTSDNQVTPDGFPRSTFNNTHQTCHDGIIGRLYPAAHFDIMPNDSFSGVNVGNIQMERIVTPYAPSFIAHNYPFFVTYRSVNRDWKKTAAVSAANGYGAQGHFPCFLMSDVACGLMDCIYDSIVQYGGGSAITEANFIKLLISTSTTSDRLAAFKALFGNSATPVNVIGAFRDEYSDIFRLIYLDPIFNDFEQYANAVTSSDSTKYGDNARLVILRMLDYFFGKGSLLDFLGYPLPRDVYSMTSTSSIRSLADNLYQTSSRPLNEFYLRANAAIWIDFFRQPKLEPLNSYLEYNDWDSNSLLTLASNGKSFANPTSAFLLITLRPAPFGEDRVTTAHLDDPSKNVYAPVLTNAQSFNTNNAAAVSGDVPGNAYPVTAGNNLHYGFDALAVRYKDHEGASVTVNCPVPSKIGNFLNSLAQVQVPTMKTDALDLSLLRTSQQLARELARHDYFGDDYFDSMKADYDVDISDAEILRPRMLSRGGVQALKNSQNIAPGAGSTGVAGEATPMGTRMAVSGGDFAPDNYSYFAQEHGVVINIQYLSMQVHYDPLSDFVRCRTYSDLIKPVYAMDNESVMHKTSVDRSARPSQGYGFEPYGNYYRTRLNEAHGKFLKEYVDYIGLRKSSAPLLNYSFMQMVTLPLGCFADNVMLDGQYMVLGTHEFIVTHSLPAPVKII